MYIYDNILLISSENEKFLIQEV